MVFKIYFGVRDMFTLKLEGPATSTRMSFDGMNIISLARDYRLRLLMLCAGNI